MTEPCCILAVYGHPDDETIHFGGTLARYAAQGARIVCLTATRGELGEIVDPSIASPDNYGRLGEIRLDEMAEALAHLGPIESRWLGYRDSGMAGDPRNDDREAFCRADPEEAAGRIARVIREVRPQVVITLGEDRGDGHPDHRQAALMAHIAFSRAGDPESWPEQLTGLDALEPWTAARLFITHGQTRAQLGLRAKLRRVVHDQGLIAAVPVIGRAVLRRLSRGQSVATPVEVSRAAATTRMDVGPWMAARDAAIRAYRTQVPPTDTLLEVPPDLLSRLSPTEDFTLHSNSTPPVPEDDLLAGLACVGAEASGP